MASPLDQYIHETGERLTRAFTIFPHNWNCLDAQSPAEVKRFHKRIQDLRIQHDAFYHTYKAHISDSGSTNHHTINKSLIKVDRSIKYKASNKPEFPLPQLPRLSHSGGLPPSLLDQRLRWQIVNAIQHMQWWSTAYRTDASWLLNTNLQLNDEWVVFLSCGLALEQLWRKKQTQAVYRNLCVDVDLFLAQCGSYEGEFGKCYESSVGNMLERLVRCQEGLRACGEDLRDGGLGCVD